MSKWKLNPDYPRPKAGEPPLHRAAREGDHVAIRALTEAGADLDEVFDMRLDPSSRRDFPATPLMVAAGSGEGATAETVALLLELGANSRVELNGRTAATFACHGLGWNYPPGGDVDRLRLLLKKGSPLPEDPEAAQRLLADTAREGDAERLKVLLDHGLSVDIYWDAEAARQQSTNLTSSLEDDSDSDLFADMPEEFRAEMEEPMRSFEAEMEEQSASAPSRFQIPLFQAVESGSEACVRLLLDAGADVAIRDNSKRTAMYYAGNEAMIKLLQSAGLPVEDEDVYGWSPLVDALEGGDENIPHIRGLIAAGANVNGTHDRGYTVFMSAAGGLERSSNLLRFLVESGADPHALTELGYNAFHAAIDVNGQANAEASVRDTLGYLKELGVDIEHRNRAGQTPLARAIEAGTAIEVQVLCDLGADVEAVLPMRSCGPDACEENARPLLFHAALGSGVDPDQKTESLLKAGANPQATDSAGATVLARLVLKFCDDAPDRDAAYDAFYEEFPDLEADPADRDAYLAATLPPIRAYVEKFALRIPRRESRSPYAEERRQETIACLAILAAYETWAEAQNG